MLKFTYTLILILTLALSGCTPVGNKTTSMSIIYLATAFLSFLLLIGYFFLMRKKNVWFTFLFSSVFVVNTGYWLLSVSKSIDTALFANRLAYLGSVFLPLTILMIILNVTRVKYPKWLPYTLFALNIFVFFIATSYPYLDIYYKAVTVKTVNGVMVLCKEYGAWHNLYLFFLLGYFSAIIAVTIHSSVKKKLDTKMQSIVLSIAAFVNICVWFLEQLVNIDFEFLSVSYIITELFLISLTLAIEDTKENKPVSTPLQTISAVVNPDNTPVPDDARLLHFKESISSLTPTETKIYNFYLEGKSTKEIMEILNIKENTLKYHNKNIYSKLGVSSRKELLYFSKTI